MKDYWQPVQNGKLKKNKTYFVRFIIDYQNPSLRDFWKELGGYAHRISFNYYDIDNDEMESLNDIYQNDYSIVYYYDLEDINLKDSLYVCFVNTISNAKDIEGLIYRIATQNNSDVMMYNTLTAFKSSKIKTISKD